ncbi:hypothetical protein E4O04_09165 [Treponema sp. OMZ 799]|uniref:hypothetical protein n=1 Tax=Treponema sp. OMZ 799 TaxID=2563668 RepID=UPI0020A3F2D8|nr:hypothetical protein [Treponema sp. OMZ 799]UTC78159.1 hypothetical protein E4O04_09165 [Treponema sp. OMZ 799]
MKDRRVVLKYFVVINWTDRQKYTEIFKKFINEFNKFLHNKEIDIIDKFEINYKVQKDNLEKFNNAKEIVDVFASNGPKKISVILENPALNLIKKDREKYLIGIILDFKEGIPEFDIQEITRFVDDIFHITYGYGFFPGKNQDIITESFIKQGLFSASIKGKQNDCKVDESIAMGNVNKFYEYNFLNKLQIDKNTILDYKSIGNNLFYYKHK